MSREAPRAERLLFRLLLLLALALLLLRLPLLNWHIGEYTDGILQLTILENENAYYPPLYALTAMPLHWLGMDLLIAGRLISALSASLLVFPIARLGRLAAGRRGAVVAAIVWSGQAIAHRWSIHAMADMYFTLWSTLAIVALVQAFRDVEHRRSWPQIFLALAGMAALTKVHGFLLLAGLPLLLLRNTRGPVLARPTHTLWALLPWAVLLAWFSHRGLQVGAFETNRFDAPLSLLLQAFFDYAWGFVRWLPYGVGYLSIFVLWGLFALRRRFPLLCWLTLGWFFLFLALHTWQLSYQLRYFLPVLPLFCAAAAAGVDALWRLCPRKRLLAPIALAAVLGMDLTFSAAVIQLQRHTFGSLALASEYLQQLPPGTRIFADEIYDQANPPNIKVRFFSGLHNISYLYTQLAGPEKRLDPALRPGDVVMLNDKYTSIGSVHMLLSRRFDLVQLYSRQVSTWPLLPDLMTMPVLYRGMPILPESHPSCMDYRGQEQEFLTIIYQLEAKGTARQPDAPSQ